MKKFIDRKEEMQFLNEEYNRTQSSLIVLFGRRRVGKTELATTFMQNKNSIYYLVTEESETQNRFGFQEMVAEFCGNELLKHARLDSWEPIFEVLCEKEQKEKLVIMIDEFQYLGKSNAAFPSIFQKIWDNILNKKNVMVILCGSLISMMISQTLSYSSPLYGRRTGQIKLKQIPFSYYKEFFPDLGFKELLEFYSVTGGVPKYMELFYKSKDIYSGIEENILSKSSFLYDEPNFLLQREVSEVGSYFSIVKAIAAGNQKLAKISGFLGIKQTGLTKYLKTLIDLDIIEREIPITEENPEKSKRGLYKIKDNYILFWFKFVYPNLSFLESGNSQFAMKKIRKNLVDSHISYVYEDICIEEMWKLNAEERWEFTFDRVGRWWSNSSEIDIVAYDSTGSDIIFGECKYWNSKTGVNILSSLEEKAKLVLWNNENRKAHYIICASNGFTEELIELARNRNDVKLWSEVLVVD